ncbi:hypothetical protein AC579_4147 [Pseudocercospora musae]|uniref:Uncharacterized protein n=1 Tax=Pseudocercospora musae TaxID=113226 RepID=A0A139GSY5_9PEZI|nr:hypothetical protein AC579_4147 [Pseudocercospora musae]
MHLHRHNSDGAPMTEATHTETCNMSCASRGEEAQYNIYPKRSLSVSEQEELERMLREQSQEVSKKRHPLSGILSWTCRLSKDKSHMLRRRPDFNRHVSSYNVACDCEPKR